MLKNYLKSSLRNLLKNPLSAFINVFGLALAVGTCMVTYAYLSLEMGMEEIHTKRDRLFMVTSLVNRDGEANLYGVSPAPIGAQLKQDFSQIERYTRINYRDVIVKRDENVFQEYVMMVDHEYFEMFDYDFVRRGGGSLIERGKVVINDEVATKYFGDEDPLGKPIEMRFNSGQKVILTVSGVVEIEPMTTSLSFAFLTSFDLLETVEEFQPSDWSTNIRATFLELRDAQDVSLIAAGANNYRGVTNDAQTDWEVEDFTMEPLSTLYDRSNEIRWDISGESDREGHVVLTIIGLFMLALACLNYLNIAIASATKRLKEIGVRKVIGANRGRLVVQFLIENLVLAFLALLMGFVIAQTIFLPGLKSLFAVEFYLDVLSIQFVIFVVGMLVLTAVASGAYPALYISRFQAVNIFRGSLKFGKRNKLTKIFLTIQYILACITVVCGITFSLNTDWIAERPWGYDRDNTMMVSVRDHASYEKLRNSMMAVPEVEQVSGGRHHLGRSSSSSILQFPDRKFEASRLDVAANYVSTMGLKVVEGRDFREDYASDETAVLINETFARQLEWDDPIGQRFRFDSAQYTVIGVLEDFHYYSFWAEILPIFLRVDNEEDYRYLALKARSGASKEAFAQLQSQWLALFPDFPFEGDYQGDMFNDFFRNINGHKVMMSTVAIMALMLSCFGLYGLVALNVAGRRKEFSIRKVLGAGLGSLVKAVGSYFMIFMIIAMVLGAPISYYLIKLFMDTIYEYHMAMSAGPVIMAILVILFTVLLTLSSQIHKVSTANPTDGLRSE